MVAERSALVVDDEPSIVLTVRLTLQRSGWEVDGATTGEEALASLEERRHDLMLLDLRLPGMDGIEVLRRAATIHPEVRVVVISAYGTVDGAVETMKLGAADFLRKPFTPDELLAVVGEVMDRETDPDELDRRYAERLEDARARIAERRFPAAIEHARRAVALDPGRPEAYHLLGVCHDLVGEQLEAQRMYRVALELDPTYGPANRNLDRLVIGGGRTGAVDVG